MGVRNEAVRLSLEDAGFSTGMAKAALATALLDRRLNDLDGTRIDFDRGVTASSGGLDRWAKQTKTVGSQIDSFSGRLGLLVKSAIALGPALVPIGGVGVAGVAALASQLGFAAVGMSSLLVAAQGVGTALEAVQKYKLDPTTKTLKEAREALDGLDPAAQAFVLRFQKLRPVLADIRNAAQAGFFPGLTESLDDLERLAPKLEEILKAVGSAGGGLIADAGKSLAGPEWAEFFDFVAKEAPPALENLGRSIGNVTMGLADLWMAVDPLSDGFSNWLLDASEGFASWADGLAETEGFQEFIEYVEANGPKVAEFASAIGDAFLQIAEAAAPFGGPMLDALTAVANAVAAIADSPIGPVMVGLASAMSAASLAAGAFSKATVSSSAGMASMKAQAVGLKAELSTIAAVYMTAGARTQREQERLGAALVATRQGLAGVAAKAAPAALAMGSLAVATNDTTSEIVGTNAAMGVTIGLMSGGGPWGVAIGALIGNLLDLQAAYQQTQATIESGDQSAAQDAFNERTEKTGDVLAYLDGELTKIGLQDAWSKITTGETQTSKLAKAAGEWESAGTGWNTALQRLGVTYEEVHGKAGGLTGALARQTRQADRAKAAHQALREAVAAQKQDIAESAAAWGDYSQKVQFGKTSLDDVIRRMRRIAEATKNEAANLRAALKKDVSPEAIANLWETLGPQGAVLALEDLAGASKKTVREFNASFGAMQGTTKGLEEALKAVYEQITGNPLQIQADNRAAKQTIEETRRRLQDLGGINAVPQVKVDDRTVDPTLAGIDRALVHTGGITATPKVRVDDGDSLAVIHGVISAMSSVHDKVVHITTVFDRNNLSIKDAQSADGGTVPKTGLPYADRHPYLLADGEEVISNRYGQADRNRSLLKAINANRLADGGTVGPSTYRASTSPRSDDPVARAAREAASALKGLQAELKGATTALEKERKERDRVVERMKQVESDVQSGLRSDLFSDQDVWSGDTSGSGILRGDIRDARAESRAIKELRDKGLDGPALAEVLSQGGLAGAQAYAEMSRAELDEFERLFNQRNRILHSVGQVAGDAAFGAQLARENKEFRELKREVREVKKAIDRASKHNHEDHKGDRDSQRKGAGSARRSGRKSWK